MAKPSKPVPSSASTKAKGARLDEHGLNPRQRLFADEYLKSGNATAAYKAAGYKAKNDAIAASAASELQRIPKVAAYIAKRQDTVREKYEITQERALQEVACGAYLDPLEFFKKDGSVKALKDMSPAARRAITEIELDEKGKPVKIKAAGKRGYLDMVFRYLQLYREAVGGITIPPPPPGGSSEVTVKQVSPEEAYRRMLKRPTAPPG